MPASLYRGRLQKVTLVWKQRFKRGEEQEANTPNALLSDITRGAPQELEDPVAPSAHKLPPFSSPS